MSHISPFDWASLLAEQPLIPIWSYFTPDTTELEVAKKVAQLLIEAGYGVLEIALREEAAWALLDHLKSTDITLIAGSVRTLAQLRRLKKMGITLAITPGWCPELCDEARLLGVRLLPGIATTGEAMQAMLRGYHEVKLFPATSLGGPDYLKSLSAPLPEMQFVPTGGINEASMASWLALPSVVSLGGSWMLPPDLIASQSWSALEQLLERSLKKTRSF